MHRFIEESKKHVASTLRRYLTQDVRGYLVFPTWGADVVTRLTDFSLRGKLIRGALVGFAYRVYDPERNQTLPESCATVGAAMELLQSFLLIHDDIMDQDELRRGGPSVHVQYARMAPIGSGQRSGRYGESMATCAGDVSALLAFDLLSQVEAPPERALGLSRLVAREIATTGLAQMQDVHHGYISDATDADIMSVYTYKTGRYTFSLPLMCGALLAGVSGGDIELLGTLGEALGRIFQIRDDRLGLFGSSETTGKPEGSDIRENKQTPYRSAALRLMPPDDPLRALFGNQAATDADIARLRDRLIEIGVDTSVEAALQADADAVRDAITRLDIDDEGRDAMSALLEYNLSRAV